MLVEKQERAERLVLCRSGDIFVGGQVGKKFLDILCTHFGGMALVVK